MMLRQKTNRDLLDKEWDEQPPLRVVDIEMETDGVKKYIPESIPANFGARSEHGST